MDGPEEIEFLFLFGLHFKAVYLISHSILHASANLMLLKRLLHGVPTNTEGDSKMSQN